VTGAGNGIGLRYAEAFAAEGTSVTIADIDGNSLPTTSASSGSRLAWWPPRPCSPGSRDAHKQAVLRGQLIKRWGQVDDLVEFVRLLCSERRGVPHGPDRDRTHQREAQPAATEVPLPRSASPGAGDDPSASTEGRW